ncbi:MAG: hypothetical protein HYS13_06920 [Planctomycetia bacterium]|nr:hypothetical protein [Planctomycetia bacterium]
MTIPHSPFRIPHSAFATCRAPALVLTAALLVAAAPALGLDTFDRHTAYWLDQVTKKGTAVAEMSSRQAAELKFLGPDVSAPCVVVRTGDGNVAKALVSFGFRKSDPKPVPVVVIERFVTYDRDRPNIALAAGKNVMLFPGFQFDLDIGQVVPDKLGGDLSFNDQRRLLPLGEAKLFGLSGSALPAADEASEPSAGPGVLPRDFAGTWIVDADGRLKGKWTLAVDDEGNVDGQHLSDETQSTFTLSGKITEGNRLQCEVQFANAAQAFDLYLWTGHKTHMAGTTLQQDRKLGVFAVRESKKKPAP